MPRSHAITARVYYEDTDAGGIVYHASYLKFAERGRTEFLRECGFDHIGLRDEHGIFFVVRRMEIDYLSPVRLDEILTVKSNITALKNASFTMRQSLFCHDVLVCSIDVILVCVTSEAKPVRLPETMREKFMPFIEPTE